MKDLILAVDVGTSRIKVALFDGRGQRIALKSEETRTFSPHPLWAEQEPNAWWLSAIRMIRSILRAQSVQRHQIRAIAVTGQMHGPVLLDKKGRAIGRCIIWQDRRATKESEQIDEKVSENYLYKLSGYRLNPYMTGPKLLWIKKNNPKQYAKAHTIVLPKDYVRSRFIGDFYSDWTDANGTGLFDMRQKDWAYDVLRDLRLDATKMPEIKPPMEVVGEIGEPVSRMTGLNVGVPVIAGSGDDVVAIGAGGTRTNEVAINLGTSCSTYNRLNKPTLDSEMRLECFVDCEEGKWFLSGTTTAATASVDWMIRATSARETGGSSSRYRLDELLPHDTRPSGLIFMPYLNGERSPIWDSRATATLFGATLQHTRQDLIRAALEGVCFTVRSILEINEQLTRRTIATVRVAGAAATSVIWMRTLANVLGRTILVPREEEATALGAAMLAAAGIGMVSNLEEASNRFLRISRRFSPSPNRVSSYERTYKRFEDVAKAMYHSPRLS